MTTPQPRRRKATLAALLVALLVLVGIGIWFAFEPEAGGDRDDAATRPGAARSAADPAAPEGEPPPGGVAPAATADPSPPADAPGARPRGRAKRPAAESPGVAPAPGAAEAPTAPAPKASRPVPASPYGRFALLGDDGAHPGRGFGSSVDVDGDVAVIGAPGFAVGSVACGAAYVFERGEDRVWRLAQRLDSPRPDMHGFASCVRVSQGRIAVFGGVAVGQNVPAFRTYVRANARWEQEAEVRTPDTPIWLDATIDGTEILVGSHRSVGLFELRDGEWTMAAPLLRPAADLKTWFGGGVCRAGDTLALTGAERSFQAMVFRRGRDGTFAHEMNLDRGAGSSIALARDGNALVVVSEQPTLTIDERTAAGWTRVVDTRTPFPQGRGGKWDGLLTLSGRHPVAGDGDLVVASGRDFDAFGLLVRRADGWASVRIDPPARPGTYRAPSMWPAWHPDVAMSGRAVVVGTQWDDGSGRAWFFDVTDEDVAATVPIGSDGGK